MKIVDSIVKCKIKRIVCEAEVYNSAFISETNKANIECISVLDARSAVYYATGICANNKEKVIVCVSSANSRSAFSGMTEAYYRNLPIVLITLGNELDYSVGLKDAILSHHIVTSDVDIMNILINQGPVHIEISDINNEIERIQYDKLNEILCGVLQKDTYLYYGQKIGDSNLNFRCKVVKGGINNSVEGALSNVLGASLAKIRKRYIGVVSEEEFLHDMNTLGNINVNDSLLYIVLAKKNNRTIISYAESLGYEVNSVSVSDINKGIMERIVNNGKKSVVVVFEEV